MNRCTFVVRIALVAILGLGAHAASAQDTFSPGGLHEAFVGSEAEEYLRLLQIVGKAPLYPWSIRGFSPPELDRLAPTGQAHPWASLYALEPDTLRSLRGRVVRPDLRVLYNSSFPVGTNDGAIWAGRGWTTALQVGGATRWGPVSLTVAPVVFFAQNAAFDLIPSQIEGAGAYADPQEPHTIDRPQRFGEGAYARIDPGQSTLRVDAAGVAVGLSTANQHWGPVADTPLVLGSNAGGYLHGFLGTASPVDLWVGKVHGRLVWGRLEQSSYAPETDAGPLRFMSGAVAVFLPRGVPGLELGGARFYHSPWPDEGGVWSADYLKPLEGLLKKGRDPSGDGSGGDVANQIASVFGRWVLPAGGIELYGEYARDDHSWDLRDFLVEPDHLSGYVIGGTKVWGDVPRVVALRVEVTSAGLTHLRRVRGQVPLYVHTALRQGHTHRGQVLGSDAAFGGGGAHLALDYFHTGGRWSAAWSRTVRGVRWEELPNGLISEGRSLDVLHTLGVETLRTAGRIEYSLGMVGAYELARGFEDDAWNLGGSFRVRMGL